MTDTGNIADKITTLTAQLQAQRKGYALPERYRANPDLSHLDDPDLPRRLTGNVEGNDDAERVKAKPATRKRKVDAVELAKRAQEAGLPVASVLATPDGGALLAFARKGDADADDAEHIETANELRALI